MVGDEPSGFLVRWTGAEIQRAPVAIPELDRRAVPPGQQLRRVGAAGDAAVQQDPGRPDRREPRSLGDDDRRGDPDDRTVVREFSRLSGNDRMQLIKRCRGVDSGGYDAALVKLCRLLETASR